MANLKGTIGGFFFKQEDTIVEDEDVKGEARIPREFMMQTETYSTEGGSLTTKQPENLKDIPIMEEIEPVENENEDTCPQISLPPIESLSQSENSCPDESDKQKAVSNEEGKLKNLNLQNEVDEIEFIISNLFTVLGELSESVGCSKTIQAMRFDLDSIKQSTSELHTGETELDLVMSSLQGVVLRAKQQGAEVEPNPVPKATFDRLLEACQKICNTANYKSLETNSSTTSKTTSSVVEDNKQQDHKQDEQSEGARAEGQQSSTVEIIEEETDSNNAVLSKEKTEGETYSTRLSGTTETILSQDSNTPSNFVTPVLGNTHIVDHSKLLPLYFLHIIWTIKYMISIQINDWESLLDKTNYNKNKKTWMFFKYSNS